MKPRTSVQIHSVAGAIALILSHASVADSADACTVAAGCGLAACGSYYTEPPLAVKDADKPFADAPLYGSAIKTNIEGQHVVLEGDVRLSKSDLLLRTGRAEFDRNSEKLTLENGMELRQPGFSMKGERADLNLAGNLGTLENAQFISYTNGARAEAEVISRVAEQKLHLKNASYTQCRPDDEAWRLQAGEIKLDYESGRGVAKNAQLRVYDVPVAWIPWINFPVDSRRATGVLWPSLGTSDGGLDISVPVYLNIAPNADATITPRHLSEHGTALEAEVRYLQKNNDFVIGGAFLDNDKQTDENRWLFDAKHDGRAGDKFGSRVRWSKVSDQDYFRDLGIANLSVKRASHLEQSVEADFESKYWRAQVSTEQYQSLAGEDKPYRKLPQIEVEYRAPPKNIGIEPVLKADYTKFDHRDADTPGSIIPTGTRVYAEAGVRLPVHGRAGSITAEAKQRHLEYRIDDNPITSDETPSANGAQFSLDAQLNLERRSDGWVQSLEPRLYYLYAEHANQTAFPDFDTSRLPFSYEQLFRPSRFAGRDRLDDADQLTVGISTSFRRDGDDHETLRLGIGQIAYFQDREVQAQVENPTSTPIPDSAPQTDERSPVAMHFRYQPAAGSDEGGRQWVDGELIWDAEKNEIDRGHLGWGYRQQETLYNAGIGYRRPQPDDSSIDRPVYQLDLSAAKRYSERTKLFARAHYDLEDDRAFENLIGIEYQSCCWLTRVVWQRALEPSTENGVTTTTADNAFLLEFQLKGLGGLGSKASSQLRESIHGYDERED